ncbi:MAG: PadR family transcriptional regulator [Frankiales bacterium]|nr:PadR family transcriptional regulator [Frankiales bacterium]
MYRTDTSRQHAGQEGNDVLELAVLGLLNESPLHGYELRQRLKATLGTFRAFSYGSLYPSLKRMKASGWITEDEGDATTVAGAPPLTGRRGKVVYKLTADGKERLADLLAEAGPSAWEDETFGVHFAFFGQTDPAVRVRILEGRRSRLEERREGVVTSLDRTRSRLDRYTLQLQEHGLESVEREVRWLTELIETEPRSAAPPAVPAPSPTTPTERGAP